MLRWEEPPSTTGPRRKRSKSTLARSPSTTTPSAAASFTLSVLLLVLLKRHVVSSNVPYAACLGAWYLFNKRAEILSSLLAVSSSWPPCQFDAPHLPLALPVLLRFLDFFPSVAGAFPGIPTAKPMPVSSRKQRLQAWRISTSSQDSSSPTVVYFKSPFSHRGQFVRTRLYALLSGFSHVVTYDRDHPLVLPPAAAAAGATGSTAEVEETLLRDAHAVYKSTANAFDVPASDMVLWGSSVMGSYSAATLCLYLMRRGTPPACLVLENPLLHLGGAVQGSGGGAVRPLDLEDRVRAICSLDECRAVPIMFVSSERERFSPSSADCHRLASLASALSASTRIVLHSAPQTQLEMYACDKFKLAVNGFLAQSVHTAQRGGLKRHRGYSTDFAIDVNSSSSLSFVRDGGGDSLLDLSSSMMSALSA